MIYLAAEIFGNFAGVDLVFVCSSTLNCIVVRVFRRATFFMTCNPLFQVLLEKTVPSLLLFTLYNVAWKFALWICSFGLSARVGFLCTFFDICWTFCLVWAFPGLGLLSSLWDLETVYLGRERNETRILYSEQTISLLTFIITGNSGFQPSSCLKFYDNCSHIFPICFLKGKFKCVTLALSWTVTCDWVIRRPAEIRFSGTCAPCGT